MSHYDTVWGEVERLLTEIERGQKTGSEVARDAQFSIAFGQLLRHSVALRLYARQRGAPDADWAKYFRASWSYLGKPLPAAQVLINSTLVDMTHLGAELTYRALVSATLLPIIFDEVDTVIELGAGWGANIFNLWLHGAPAMVSYIAAEPTREGRTVAERIAAMQGARRLSAVPFDCEANSYDFTQPPPGRNILIFSCHSIEQVKDMPADFFARLLGRFRHADKVRGVHIEPMPLRRRRRRAPWHSIANTI